MKFILLKIILCFLILAKTVFAAEVKEVFIPSPSMNTNIPGYVILPDDYSKTNRTYPVVYILHGYSSSPRRTLDEFNDILRSAANHYQMIMVLPDGGYNSWYIDSPVRTGMKYETFIADELVSFVDSNYRSIPSSRARAITGGSMGGYGAMFIGVRHVDVFGIVGSLSGGVDFRPFPDNWDVKLVLGPFDEFPQRWDAHVVINNLQRLKPGEPTIYLDVGTSDPFLEVNRALHKKLLEMRLPHVYVERPGHHDTAYWEIATQYQLFFFAETFNEKQAAKESTPSQKAPN
jgi:S-formylglutathione hydrolase FrmB